MGTETKNFIEELSQKIVNYNTPEQAISQANSCDSLSNDIYTDSKRFIYELLQNADDASSQTGKLDFQIDFAGKYIIVSHKGEPFTESDIKSICSVGDGNKNGDENKTGFKGIGFKSVFAHSEFVIIKSGNYCFKFDKNECNKWNTTWGNENDWKAERKVDNKDDEIKMPWQIIPICTEMPNELKHLSVFEDSAYNVSTIIQHNGIEQLKESLIELFSESQIVLFLRSKEIKITINTTESLLLEKSKVENTTFLKRNNEIISEWLIKTEQFDIPQDIQALIKDNNRYPRKLRESKRTEISFAIQLGNDRLKVTDKEKRLIFTYLPTSINYDLPFLINANFLTDAGRENIHKDLDWNQWLFKQIPLKYFAWIAELATKGSKYNKQFLSVVPQKLSAYNELETNFNNGYEEAIKTIAFIPNSEGDLLKVSDALFDETNISDFISKQTLINYINSTPHREFSESSFIPHLHPISVLKLLGVETFVVKDLDRFFASDIFSSEHQLSENFNLITFLYQQAQNGKNDESKAEWNMRLKTIPFIFDETGNLQKPEHIYFSSVEYSNDFSNDISIIHNKVLNEINKNQSIKKWLESLGVKEPTDINFIEKTIIGQSDFVTKDNVIKVGRYLFNAHKKGSLTESHYQKLQNFSLFTKQNNLISANEAFLSDFYDPELKLEPVCEIDLFVSEDYYSEEDLKSEWKTFFLKIGVKEDIEWTSTVVMRNSQNNYLDRFDGNFFTQIPVTEMRKQYEYISGNGNHFDFFVKSFLIYHFSFVQYTNEHEFSKLFWKRAFNSKFDLSKKDSFFGVNDCYYVVYEHRYYLFDIIKISYFQWTINNLALFPTTHKDCRNVSGVFNNNIPQVREIAGKYLPILDYEGIVSPEWLEVLKFKEQLKLEDYLEILSQIWQDTNLPEEELKENKKRVCLIYEKLAEKLNGLHSTEKDKLKNWANNNKLLAKDGNFYSAEELSLVTVEGFNADNLIYTEKKPDEKIIELFDLWGVKIIDSVTPKFSNSIAKMENLRTQLEYIAPLIALLAVEKSKNKKEWEDEFQRIKNKLSEISFYETAEIHISYGNEQDEQERSTYADGNNFYYVGNWYKPRVLDGLVEPLCKFLNIRYAERMLTVLLSDEFAEGLKYLKEKGFDISLIPENLINPPVIKYDHNQKNRDYNQSDEDLGKKGEMFVFEELKRIYEEKYNHSIEETDTGFKIGNKIEVLWRNKTENTTANHDFKVIESGKEIYIDSKATPSGKNVEKVALYISGNELNLMERADKYLIARVFNVTGEPEMELIKLEVSDLED
jgi:hypothetical protein